jgi:hypothetical protein
MAGLEGTIKTPLGVVQKKTALVVGGGVVVLAAIVWYRSKQMGLNEQTEDADAPINPATGFPFGSPEDAAALQEQASYVSPQVPTGGGSGIPPSNVGYSSNGEWSQAVVQYMIGNSLVEDPTKLSAALGKYLTAAYATAEERSLIQQAIAVMGFPPVAGASGYPPSINTTVPASGGTPEAGKPGVPTGLKFIELKPTSLKIDWQPVVGATHYQFRWANQTRTTAGTQASIGGLTRGGGYSVYVAAKNANGTGPETHISTRLPKK